MDKNSHRKFVDALRIPTEITKHISNTTLEPNEEELIRELEKRFDQLFGSIDDNE